MNPLDSLIGKQGLIDLKLKRSYSALNPLNSLLGKQGLIDLKLKKELFSIEPAELIDWQTGFNRPQTKKGVRNEVLS